MAMIESCPLESGSPVVAYLRHSPGEEQTISSQESAVRSWCDEHHLLLVRVFKDEAQSGTTTAGREQFLQMIDLLRGRQIQPCPAAVLLWSFSRFARDVADAEYYKWALRHDGYEVFSMTDSIPSGDLAPIFESFIHWKDAERSREISRDAKRGLRWLAEQGFSVGGFPPRGYRKSSPVEVGRKKNSEPRLGRKWEIDPEFEPRVRLAWQMKLAGASHWEIHHATHLCASPRGYTEFFANETYAGIRKCGDLRVENAHPAYVSKEDFDRIQAQRQPRIRLGEKFSDTANHPARRKNGNRFLLSGILRCGYCGWAMVGMTNGKQDCYRCDWRRRQGHHVCEQPAIVAYALHDAVCEWIARNIATYDRLIILRDQFNAALSESGAALRGHQRLLLDERERIAKQISNLVTAVERGGWADEIRERLESRKVEKQRIDLKIDEVEARLAGGNVRVSDEVLHYLADHMQEVLLGSDNVDAARALIRHVLAEAKLYKEKLVLHYTVEPLMQMLAPSARAESVFWTVPPREFESLFWP